MPGVAHLSGTGTIRSMERAEHILKTVFGYDSFRNHQADIIRALIAGKDAFTLMPTGGGKSICYQIPALIREGTAIVVSPLIALMQDQVDALRQLGIRAAFLNSTLNAGQARQIEADLQAGALDILYLAPERLLHARTLSLLANAHIALFAIDEAHCVSQWGHDFRKEYQQLSILPEQFPNVPRIALTATADARTRNEIIRQLSLQQAEIFINSFDRPNIRYAISDSGNSREELWRFLEQEHGDHAGIVYCLSRKNVERTAEWLNDKGRIALPYHAGLDQKTRARNQQRFLREEGLIIVATIAFGMGIDKPDVRFVAHLNLPKNIESYYQETGRAGRDGLPADAWMSYGLKDVINLRLFTENSDAEVQFKRLMHQKTDAMLGLCELTGCRRQALLAYFDEALEQPCGNCDNCLTPPETWDATIAVQKALSCVYRTRERFGAQYLINILTGKSDERIRQNGHDRIPTFAVGNDLHKTLWRTIFRQLVALGYLAADSEGYGVLKLTEQAWPLLKRNETPQPVMLRALPKRSKAKSGRKKSGPANSLPPEGEALFERLRLLRRQIADEQNVPPYVIFPDKTLIEMTIVRPEHAGAMLDISGVGETRLKRYGQRFLDEISSGDEDKPATEAG